jgi:histidine triad (HIT) family protein
MRLEWTVTAAGGSAARAGTTTAASTSAVISVFMALELSPMADCLFCKIVDRKIPASLVYEDERIVAFNDVNPQAPTHVLLIPKRHIESLNAIGTEDDQLIGELVRRAALIAKERGLSDGGFRAVFNTNRDAGQSVFHIHLHLLGGRPMHWPPG